MTEKLELYKCSVCGNLVQVLLNGVGELNCCGQPMELLLAHHEENSELAEKLSGIKAFIITEENLELLFKFYSFNEYQEFYNKQFLSIPEFEIDGVSLFEEYYEYE